MTEAAYLSMHGLSKAYPGVVALRGANLEVRRGEAVALMGANGAGKSTLMNVLGGVTAPDAGSITIDSSPELRRVLLRMLRAPDGRRLTLDFSEVVYIDTSGLAVLLEVLRSARQLGKRLQLGGLRERPRYLFESTGLLRLFDEAPLPANK